MAQAYYILKHKTPVFPEAQHVVLSFGINNREQGNPGILKESFERLQGAAFRVFQNAVIHIPLINCDKALPSNMIYNIKFMNGIIEKSGHSIPILPWEKFRVEVDHIHWTPSTAQSMFQHWLEHLKLVGGPTQRGPLVNKKSVIYLSQCFRFTPAQVRLLDRGLSFIPSHLIKTVDKGSLLADLGQFHAKMQRAVFFGPNTDTGFQSRPFCEGSGWVPPPQKLPREIWDFF